MRRYLLKKLFRGGIAISLVLLTHCGQSDTYQGNGIWQKADGSTYQGTFIAGRPHGKGKLKLLNGFEYFGDWIDGEISGYGQITYSNGNVYVGNLIQAQPNGLGKMTYISGKIFNGIWDLGKEKKSVE